MIPRQTTALVESHCQALEACADQMSAAGIGLVPVVGHVDRLKRMAYDLRASAAAGIIPDRYTMVGERDMVAASPEVIRAALERPDVRSVSHLLRKYAIEITAVQSVNDFDLKLRAQACPLSDRLVLKSSLMRAGLVV
jgi:hypothetical protein